MHDKIIYCDTEINNDRSNKCDNDQRLWNPIYKYLLLVFNL